MAALGSLLGYQTSFTAAAQAAGGYGSLTVTVPAEATDGKLLVLFVNGGRGGADLVDYAAQGFENPWSISGGGAIYQRIASSEPASYTFQTADGTGSTTFEHAVVVVAAAFTLGTPAYDESFPEGTGTMPGWLYSSSAAVTNAVFDSVPSPFGWTDMGDITDTSVKRYYDIFGARAVTSGTTTGAAYTLPTIDSVTGTATLFGTETTLPQLSFSATFKSRWKWAQWGRSTTNPGGTYSVAYSGGSGNYLMNDQPVAWYQVFMDVDPDAVPPPDTFDSNALKDRMHHRKWWAKALPYNLTTAQLPNVDVEDLT